MVHSSEYNTSTLVGTPFAWHGRSRAGADCWGLVMLHYREQLGVELKDVAAYEGDPRGGDDKLFRGEELGEWELVDFPIPNDVLVLQDHVEALGTHVGVLLPGGMVLHTCERTGAILTPFKRLKPSLLRAYRYVPFGRT